MNDRPSLDPDEIVALTRARKSTPKKRLLIEAEAQRVVNRKAFADKEIEGIDKKVVSAENELDIRAIVIDNLKACQEALEALRKMARGMKEPEKIFQANMIIHQRTCDMLAKMSSLVKAGGVLKTDSPEPIEHVFTIQVEKE